MTKEKVTALSEIRDLASATYGITFPEKSFTTVIIKELGDKGLLEIQKSTSGIGAKSPLVKLSDTAQKEIVEPFLKQIEETIGKEIAAYT